MLSNNLRILRKLKGWSQQKTADNLEIGLHKYQSYEEARAEPNIELLKRIATLYKITLDSLITEDMERKEEIKELKRLKKKYPDEI
jgi:transcriptional regulator with XRE-family HTH domain